MTGSVTPSDSTASGPEVTESQCHIKNKLHFITAKITDFWFCFFLFFFFNVYARERGIFKILRC